MFAQDFCVLTLPLALFALVRFLAPHRPLKVRSFWLELTLSPLISILVKLREN